MYLFFIIFITLSLLYFKKVRSSHLCKTVLQYPPCLFELSIFGCSFNFLGNSEETMKTLMRGTYNIMKVGGASRLYTINTFHIGFTDASDITEVLATHLDKHYIYFIFQTFTGSGSAFAPAAVAKSRRQLIMPFFSPRILNSYIDDFWKESVSLSEKLAPYAGAGPFCAVNYLNAWSFDTILRTMDVKASDQDFDTKEFWNAVNMSEKLARERLVTLWMYSDFLHKFSTNYAESQRTVKILYHNAGKVLQKRRNAIENYKQLQANTDSTELPPLRESIFDGLLKSNLTDKDICDELILTIGATGLSGSSIGFTLMLLGLYPSVQDKVYEELQNVFAESDSPITKDDFSKLNYLDMVIKESLRLYPPAPFIARTAKEDVTLSSGRVVPEGAGLLAAIIGLHRNPKYWGPDAEHFDPDRFLPERFEKVNPNAFVPFSFGSRNCMGYKYAQMAMKTALSTILRKYKIVGEPAKGPIPNIRTKFEIFMKAANNFEIEIVNRI